ncbi:hypothetical protein PSAC2689_70391 [Paraburkholderia sacchari]
MGAICDTNVSLSSRGTAHKSGRVKRRTGTLLLAYADATVSADPRHFPPDKCASADPSPKPSVRSSNRSLPKSRRCLACHAVTS